MMAKSSRGDVKIETEHSGGRRVHRTDDSVSCRGAGRQQRLLARAPIDSLSYRLTVSKSV